MKRKHHLAFRLRDLVERHCKEVPPAMGLHLLNEIDKHLAEEQPKDKTHEKEETRSSYNSQDSTESARVF